MRTFTEKERASYIPDLCPGCGRPVDQSWLNATRRVDPEPLFVLGRWACHTAGCHFGPHVEAERKGNPA